MTCNCDTEEHKEISKKMREHIKFTSSCYRCKECGELRYCRSCLETFKQFNS
jgi:hypothetical protein